MPDAPSSSSPTPSHLPRSPRIQVPPNCELTLGMRCLDKSQPGRTTWEMGADERFANPAGIIQGGFLSAMADSAMGSAAVTFARAAGRSVIAANVEMKTSFMAAVRVDSVLRCTATIVSGGERVAFAEAEVLDDLGRMVVRATSTYLYTERAPRDERTVEPLGDGGAGAPTSL
ncbi:MAG: PaaI family thioesterase [Acidimicrobiales bacterium]